MTTVEIWMGNTIVRTITPRRIETSIDGAFVKITDLDGSTVETSPHNIIICHYNKEKGGEE
jgi:hypothetical protein